MFGFDAAFYTKTHMTLVIDPVKNIIDFLLGSAFAIKQRKSQQMALL